MGLASILAAPPAQATPSCVNALVLVGNSVDASGGTAVNNGRMGFFSDIHYDAANDEWWALSDCGPGGGTLRYENRVHRFNIDVDRHSGAISNF